jgi:hypothetical protein
MDIQARILVLASKKVAKEAGRKELAELNALLRNNPEIKASLTNVFDQWENIHFENIPAEKEIDDNIAAVLVRIHQQINASPPGAYARDEDQ